MDPDKLARAINQTTWSPKYEQILQEPYNYLSSIPGKEIRSKLIEAFNTWLNVPEEDLSIVKNVAYQELFKFRRRKRDEQDSTPAKDSEVYLDEVITGE
ncbi:hypothetical protein QFC22_002701 [Naganishia vaughanmartiniae]|uniref:Uncharacterized protein n=1 Tax=Naganishia vaughanmartiniae TaxID=1424756 RepID=A0ACC2XBH1_9TREE|nr:hypothetical protein QFC22_002701 [Naganishia vaughanmartiniae]